MLSMESAFLMKAQYDVQSAIPSVRGVAITAGTWFRNPVESAVNNKNRNQRALGAGVEYLSIYT